MVEERVAFPEERLPTAIEAIRRHTGVDFAGYRRPMLGRRLANHMIAAHISDPEAYLAELAASPITATEALRRIAIKVSAFFRNPDAFAFIARALLPAWSSHAARVLCAGCATGEEAWSLAALFAQRRQHARIDAIDIDELALATARRGTYATASAGMLSDDRRDLLGTEDAAGLFVIADRLRASVHFTATDISALSSPAEPIYDLVSCRNVLIYMERERQHDCLRRLVDQLRPGGYLFLGEAEWPTAELPRLEVLHTTHRIFRKRLPRSMTTAAAGCAS